MYEISYRGGTDDRMKLLEDYTYSSYTVKKGFKSDGLTIPFFFKIFVNKYSPKYMPCAFIHDKLTNEAYRQFTFGHIKKAQFMFNEADSVFKEMLTIADKGKVTFIGWSMVTLVKVYHNLRYGA